MILSTIISKRESVRAYLDKEVSTEAMEKIIEAGRWAPNAGPFQISVILNAGLRQRINDRAYEAMIRSDNKFLKHRASLPDYQPLYGAPVLILFSGPAEAPYSRVNTALAAGNMILQAAELGLGTCYLVSPSLALKGKNNQDLAHEAGIPDGYEFQCAIVMGYAAEENKFSLGVRKRKGSVNYVE